MPHSRFIAGILVSILLVILSSACGGGDATDEGGATQSSTRSLEVVIFATQPSATPTILPTKTPLPTALPLEDATTPTVLSDSISITPSPSPSPTPSLQRAENENPLTGLTVNDPAVLKRPPLHVRIGNDPQARPQVNLSQADLVYEEIVEWWTTRLTAVYYSQSPEMVAPVRSARLINGQLTQQYNAVLANSGGSDGVRWELSQLPIINLDEYFHPKPYFYREGEPWQRRLAVNIALAYEYLADQGMETTVSLRGFAFDPTPPPGGDLAETIYIDYPAKESKALWRFNPDTGEYERYAGGEPMIDAATNKIISVPNVIVYFAEHSRTDIVEDSTGATSVRIEANGEGDAWIFRDRTLLKGHWRTDGSQTPEFIDAAGDPIPLHPGRSWIQVVPTDYEILVNEVP